MRLRSTTTAIIAIAVAAATAIIATAILFYVPLTNTIGLSTASSSSSHPSISNGSQLNSTQTNNSTTKSIASSSSSSSAAVGTAGYRRVNVTINDYSLVAYIADTQDKMYAGLDVRDYLNESEGMLFPFSIEAQQGFWMKGMKFPIDIIWLDKDKKVVHIEPSLAPCTPFYCPTYTPSQPAMYVLETVSGFAAKHHVTEGTLVQFDLNKQW